MSIKENIRKTEIKNGKNRFGLDMQYFHEWFERSLFLLNDYKPTELARELARMSKAADSNVILEKEFSESLQSRISEFEKALNSFNPVCYCQCCKDVERFKDDYSMR